MAARTILACRNFTIVIPLVAAASFCLLQSAPAIAADIRVDNAVGTLIDDAVNGRRIEIYMEITNDGGAPDRLYAVRSRLSGNTMISVVQHSAEHGHNDNHMNMVDTMTDKHLRTTVLDVPGRETAVLEHGGSHIMLMDPGSVPEPGATFPVTLFFEGAGRVSVDVTMEAMTMH